MTREKQVVPRGSGFHLDPRQIKSRLVDQPFNTQHIMYDFHTYRDEECDLAAKGYEWMASVDIVFHAMVRQGY